MRAVRWGLVASLAVFLLAAPSAIAAPRNGAPERFLFRTPGRLEVYSLDAD
jgi:hypothetical protein